MQKHIVYLLCCLFAWISCCVVWAAELHQASQDGAKYSVRYGDVTIGGTDFTFDQCKTQPGAFGDWCGVCSSGGKGAVAMSVFAWLGFTFIIAARMLVLASAHTRIPWLGEDQARYAVLEKVTGYVSTAFLLLVLIIWGATCITKTTSLPDGTSVIPTGYVFVVFAFLCMIGGCILIHQIHEETAFSTGGGGSGGSVNAANTNAGAAPARASAPPPQPPAQPRGPPPRPPPQKPTQTEGDAV